MFLATIGVPALTVLSLAGDQAVLGVSDRAPELASAVVLVAVGAAVGLLARHLIEDEVEVVGVVLLTTVGVPALIALGLSGNLTVLGVGDSSVKSARAVLLVTLGSGDDVSELLSHVLLAAVGVPALAVGVGLSGDLAVLGVGHSAPEVASAVILLALSWVNFVVEDGGAATLVTNEVEIVGVVFLAAVRVPTVVALGLSGNAAVLGLGDGAPESAGAVVLPSLRAGTDTLEVSAPGVVVGAAGAVGTVTVHSCIFNYTERYS